MHRYYIIYKITNIINSKEYIGAHSTDNINDGYMGSGTLIRAALLKYDSIKKCSNAIKVSRHLILKRCNSTDEAWKNWILL